VARPLFILMYGERWLPAVLPFQILCAGGILKLLNAYASQANEATGNIWPQVWRQAIGAVCIVAGAYAGARGWGVAGAATGVAIGMAVLTVSMQALVRRVTGLTWGEMLRPQVPAVACTALVVGVLVAVAQALPLLIPEPAAWQQLIAQVLAGSLAYGLFVLFSPFAALNEVVNETIHQLLPARAADRLDRVRRLERQQSPREA
jgi:O-antigen/teichoic acid export membrane protein